MPMFNVPKDHGWAVGDTAYCVIGGPPMIVLGIMKDQDLKPYGCMCGYWSDFQKFEAFTFPFDCISDGEELEDVKRSAL